MLTIDGTAEFVIEDLESHQLTLDRLDELEVITEIWIGIADAAQGRTMPLGEAQEELRVEFGFSD